MRELLREKRKELRELRAGMKEGRDLSADMDTCEGEIEVLQKELQSIDEGGHATFVEAKDLIAPKKEISAKKTKTIIEDTSVSFHSISFMWSIKKSGLLIDLL